MCVSKCAHEYSCHRKVRLAQMVNGFTKAPRCDHEKHRDTHGEAGLPRRNRGHPMQDVCLHISDQCRRGRGRVALGEAHGEVEAGNRHEVFMVDRITFRWITVLFVYIKEASFRFIRPLEPTATSDTMPPNPDMISVITNDHVILPRSVDPPKKRPYDWSV